jgi:hypothetical protein
VIIIGCDWSRDKHEIHIMNRKGDILFKCSVAHSAEDLADLAKKIRQLEPNSRDVHIGIERHNGAILGWFLDKGYTVYGINPKSAQRARDRYRPSGSKDDNIDSFALADMIRTDCGYLRPIQQDSHRIQELREWIELRLERVKSRTVACQRLRSILAEWSPALSCLCDNFRRQWQRQLLLEFPLHQDLHAAHGNRINAFEKRCRLREKARIRLRECKVETPMNIPKGRLRVLRREVRFLVEAINRLTDDIEEIEEELKRLVDNHPDAVIFRSLPVRGTVTLAALLVAFGDDRNNIHHWREYAARWGVAPITIASGKSHRVRYRKACDHTINQSLLSFAFNTSYVSECWASEYYKSKREKGTKHYTALRCLAQRWVKILTKIWKDRLLYDESLHQMNKKIHEDEAA